MIKVLKLRKAEEIEQAEIDKLKEELDAISEKVKEIEAAIEQAETAEDLAAIEAEIDELTENEAAKNEELAEREAKIEEIKSEIEAAERKAQKAKETRKAGVTPMIEEKRAALNSYIHSGETRDGFTSTEGGALVPVEVLAPFEKETDGLDLVKYVNSVSVNSGGGKYPYIKRSGNKMASVAELAKNPALANPDVTEIDWSAQTYRGYIPVSQEIIEDAAYDVTGIIGREIADQARNTRNGAIVTALKTMPKVTATNLDALKTLANVTISRIYDVKFIMTASMFDAIDKMKDGNGRYLLQDSIGAASGKSLFGHEIVIVDDKLLGSKAGDMVAFVGDPKCAVSFFDRAQASVKWVDNDVYGTLLASYVRFDVKATDTDAGRLVTLTLA